MFGGAAFGWLAPGQAASPASPALLEPAEVLRAADDFNRADGPLGAPWVTPSGFDPLAIVGNQVGPAALSGSGTERFARYTGATLPAHQAAEVTLAALAAPTGGNYASVAVGLRWTGTTGYLIGAAAQPGETATYFVRLNNGVWTDLDWNFADPWAPGDRLRAEVNGAVLAVYRNGTLVRSITDATPILGNGQGGVTVKREVAADLAAGDAWQSSGWGLLATATVGGTLTVDVVLAGAVTATAVVAAALATELRLAG